VEALVAAVRRVRDAAGAPLSSADVRGTTFDAHGATLTTAGGEAVGGYVTLRPRDAEPAGVVGVRRSLLAAGALGLALALAAAYVAARRVTRPVRALAAAARRAADGDYAPAADGDPARPAATPGRAADARAPAGDEIAALAEAFETMLAGLRGKQALVSLLGGAPPADAPRAPLSVVRAAPRTRAAVRGAAPPADARPTPRAHAGPEPGQVFADRYAVERIVGAGGMGVVFKASDLRLGEPVALKVLRADVLATDPQAAERLVNEIRLARRISHRNVVRTHDLGEHAGVTFVTMEYVEGSSLAAMLRARGPLPPAAVLSVATQLCRALGVAHEQGVVHGDIKPQNILVGADGVLKVTDFGVARLVRRPGVGRAPADIAGAVVGTPEYMAPEQLLGHDAGVLGDIYAAGVVLHECVTGATPFGGDTPLAFFARKLDPPPQSRRAERPRATAGTLDDVIARMTAPDPADRPASAAELYELFARAG
jgi:serine/threonine-protein kinase